MSTRVLSLLISVFCLAIPLHSQEVFQTKVNNKLVKSLQVKVAGEVISDPFIFMDGEEQIEINFDLLEAGYQRYAYSLVHCDADWKQSTLIPMEYTDGFQGLTLDDYASGRGTTVAYTNYRMLFPNENMNLKVSGNYVVRIYREEDPNQTILTACFSVVEPVVNVSSTVSSNTLIDTNNSHQQVSFTINTSRFPIPYPQNDLKIWVYQNNRRDNAVTGIQPMGAFANQIEYSNIRELIFEAGNEYRRFEFLSPRYNGMHVEDIAVHHPYYHVTLMKDIPRSRRSYLYDQDQNGRFFIRCSNCSDPDTDSDYFFVHFALESDLLMDGTVYLSGELFNNVLDENSKMGYNRETGMYEKSVLLKQGNYNYQYLFVPNGKKQATTSVLEGNYFQTENEYTIYVYYRPIGERYDRLIGVSQVDSGVM